MKKIIDKMREEGNSEIEEEENEETERVQQSSKFVKLNLDEET